MNKINESVENMLENRQREYASNVIKNTAKEELLVLVEGLKFCEENYKHNHEGVEKYIRSNHAFQDDNGEASLSETYENIKKAVDENENLRNFGHADLLTRSLLEYMRNAAPKDGRKTEAELMEILKPVLFNR